MADPLVPVTWRVVDVDESSGMPRLLVRFWCGAQTKLAQFTYDGSADLPTFLLMRAPHFDQDPSSAGEPGIVSGFLDQTGSIPVLRWG